MLSQVLRRSRAAAQAANRLTMGSTTTRLAKLLSTSTKEVDVLIVGSGPIGSTFARKLAQLDPKLKVMMVDAGPQSSPNYGEHLKNATIFQRNIDQFVHVIQGHLIPSSVPGNLDSAITLDPSSFRFDPDKYKGFVLNGQNPDQVARLNLNGCASTYCVGGMGTHWTCSIPQFHKDLELNWTENKSSTTAPGGPSVTTHHKNPIPANEWPRLYKEAHELLGVDPARKGNTFEGSIRHQVVKSLLKKDFPEITELPLAVNRRTDNKEFVTWSSGGTILGDLSDPQNSGVNSSGGSFELCPEHQCTHVEFEEDHGSSSGSQRVVKHAVVWPLQSWQSRILVKAKVYILACNAVLTPQVLFKSGLTNQELPALGRYITEQPMAFAQVVLRQEVIDNLENYVADNRKADVALARQNPYDPVPIPKGEPEPNLGLLATPQKPWHCQIHRDAFSYGGVSPNVDSRLIVDLRWFGITRPRKENRIEFSSTITDSMGMPQPTFFFQQNEQEREEMGRMMSHLLQVASKLGGFLPGSEPQFMAPGLALHLAGSVRMGTSKADSVVDSHSKVWDIQNLYLGGNGLHPFGNASNPTLTSIAMAVRAAEAIANQIRST